MTDVSRLESVLKSHGASMTEPRRTVFSVLSVQHAPLTVQELAAACPEVDQASVYRTVKIFEQTGIAVRILSGSQSKVELSDLFSPHHHHIVCVDCGKIIGLHEDKKLEEMISSLANRHDFSELRHSLEINGICSDCQKKALLNVA